MAQKNPYKEIQIWMDDKEILQIVNLWSQRWDIFRAKLETEGKRNYKYFIWKYDRDIQQIPVGRSNLVDNRIFSAIKSVVPFVTSKPAQPVCYAKKDSEDKQKTEESKFISNCTQDILKKLYNDSQVQKLNEQNSINRYIYKIGLLRYWLRDWKLFTRVVTPKNCIFDEWAKQFKDSLYIWEPVEYTAEELIVMFPTKEKDILAEIWGKQDIRIKCIEWWTQKVNCITMWTKVVLNIKENPFTNKQNENLNYYEKSPIPYVALNVYNTWDCLIDDISEIDLTYLMQDSVNDITRATVDNVKYCWNPIKIWYWLNSEQMSLIWNAEPWDSLVLWKDQVFQYVQATWMPAFVENTLQTLKNEIDAIFGTQATFRGEFEWIQSWVSRDILRQQAANSLAQLSRGIERMMDDLYRGWLHLIMIYCDDPEFVKVQIKPILWDRTDKYVEYLFNADDWIEVSVLPGTILPDDPVTKSDQAMALAWMNRITNELLYESIGISNPNEEAEKLDLNQTIIAIKAQELQQREQQAQQETQVMRNEADNINKAIDSLDWWETTDTGGQPQSWIPAPVNISIWNQPWNPAPNEDTSKILDQIKGL